METNNKDFITNPDDNNSNLPFAKCDSENTAEEKNSNPNQNEDLYSSCTDETPAFSPASKQVQKKTETTKYVEPDNVFAQGLPSWSIEPPQVLVRRH